MADVVVTLPKSFGLKRWREEGDNPGEPWSGLTSYWSVPTKPKIEPGERVYVVHDGKLIGYAPLVEIFSHEGMHWLARRDGAVACTIIERITGFRGYRYRWWGRDEEIPTEEAS